MGDTASDPHDTDEVPSDVHMGEGGAHTGKSTVSPSHMELGAPVRCVRNDK